MEDYFIQEITAFIQGIPTDPLTGAVSEPIYQTSTFVQEASGVHKGYDYARYNNPTGIKNQVLSKCSGAINGPFDSWLMIRGMETLTLLMRQHS